MLLNEDYKKLKETAKQRSTAKRADKEEIKHPANLIHHCIPILASLPLVYENHKINTTLSVKEARNCTTIETPNGDISGNNLAELIVYLYYVNRSEIAPAPMTEHPTLGSCTPLLMYAHRLHNDIPYSAWDRRDTGIRFALGKYLEPILDVKSAIHLTQDEVINYRKESLAYKTGPKVGSMDKLTSNKCNIPAKLTGHSTSVVKMLLQTWICNASIRDESSMILDPFDWDRIPPPVDSLEQTQQDVAVEYERIKQLVSILPDIEDKDIVEKIVRKLRNKVKTKEVLEDL